MRTLTTFPYHLTLDGTVGGWVVDGWREGRIMSGWLAATEAVLYLRSNGNSWPPQHGRVPVLEIDSETPQKSARSVS